MEQVSTFLKVFFILTAFLTVWQFYRASYKSKPLLILLGLWMLVQCFLALTGFYNNQTAIPPRLMLQLGPPLIFILVQFLTISGKNFIDSLNIKKLTLIHTIRIPVEIVLYFLFIAKAIPQIMTFEGRNFDILAGLTAPIIFYFGFVKNKLSNRLIIVWNLICLGLLLNIIGLALLSAKTPFQQFAFNETNIALGHFPFNWLPSVVVPIVLFSHLSTLRQLIVVRKKK